MIYVTHDQTEALTFADKVVVMHEGRVVQMGTPEELFETPGAYLRRLFHRLAGDEPAGRRSRGHRGASCKASQCRLGAAYGPTDRPDPDRHPPGIRDARATRACRSTVTPGRGRGPPPHRARPSWPGQPLNAILPEGHDRRRRLTRVGLRAGQDQRLRRRLARRAGELEGPPDGQDRRTTRPGSWSCRCWCWWPFRP